MWSKLYATRAWKTGDLSDGEVAAAEIDAFIFWAYAEAAFEQYREGLMSESSWRETELEIIQFSNFGAMRAIYNTYYRETPTDFTRAISRLLSGATPTNDP